MRSSSRHSSGHDPAAPAIFVAVPRDHVAMLGDCASIATLRHDRFSERSYLFTMSDITPAHQASQPHGASERRSLRTSRNSAGGARRNRTDDLLLAKQALSQLSYGPDQRTDNGGQRTDILSSVVCCLSSDNWWAWEDLNFRPHAYQARALTN